MNTVDRSFKWVMLLCATATAGYMCRVNVSTAAPLLMQEFGLSQIEMGRVFSAFLLGYALCQVPSGILADRFGTKKVLGWAAWLWVLITVIQTAIGVGALQMPVTMALYLFMAGRFLLGVAASPMYPASSKGVSEWVPVHLRGTANGIVLASVGLGSALAPLVVSNIMVLSGWRAAMVVSAVPALLVALLWLRAGTPVKAVAATAAPHAESRPVTNVNGYALKSRSFILLTISYSLQGYVGYIFVSWFYLYLVQERHFGLLSGAWMSSLPWILSIISIPLGGWLADRFAAGRIGVVKGRRVVPMLGMGLSGLLISIGAHTENPVVAALTLAFATAFVLCVEGPFWAMMTHIAGNQSGRAGGIMNTGSNVGGLISPMLTPVLAAYIGWEYALHVAALLAVIASLLWWGVSAGEPALQSERT